eukprot:CAMPEP_0117656926 /NCGR_PEP_ID=MMETSP0804-20121206/5059_1 /TAXON_ID=1074897 /ORGANISM="Tetraselmis astigmatica, Strain CCMP880" /LENGTH=83 /DNA_ID=CAMNT_0005463349 /DNA_START=188 /DNA_END=439 /DNA_ORIENTATION=+
MADQPANSEGSPPLRQPRPHRCNDRLEDFVQAIFEWKPREYLIPTWKNFWRCMEAEPGSEPNDPYLLWTPAASSEANNKTGTK